MRAETPEECIRLTFAKVTDAKNAVVGNPCGARVYYGYEGGQWVEKRFIPTGRDLGVVES